MFYLLFVSVFTTSEYGTALDKTPTPTQKRKIQKIWAVVVDG
jgi:hypothetical protein